MPCLLFQVVVLFGIACCAVHAVRDAVVSDSAVLLTYKWVVTGTRAAGAGIARDERRPACPNHCKYTAVVKTCEDHAKKDHPTGFATVSRYISFVLVAFMWTHLGAHCRPGTNVSAA